MARVRARLVFGAQLPLARRVIEDFESLGIAPVGFLRADARSFKGGCESAKLCGCSSVAVGGPGQNFHELHGGAYLSSHHFLYLS